MRLRRVIARRVSDHIDIMLEVAEVHRPEVLMRLIDRAIEDWSREERRRRKARKRRG